MNSVMLVKGSVLKTGLFVKLMKSLKSILPINSILLDNTCVTLNVNVKQLALSSQQNMLNSSVIPKSSSFV